MEKKYYKHKIENLLVISKIITIHYFEFDKSFTGPTESHDFWELVYAHKGDIICYADGKEEILKEGEVIFHKPNEIHSLKADGKRAPNVFIISFECKSEAVRFFEHRSLRLQKDLLHLIFSIIEESKKTFDLPYSDPELKKMKLLPSPALGGRQAI
jgi:quercetin dioxygenase-like cupin family protein